LILALISKSENAAAEVDCDVLPKFKRHPNQKMCRCEEKIKDDNNQYEVTYLQVSY
jgi:hypothetical protein